MKNCPVCGKKTFVIDTAETKAGIRRRRKCPANHRTSTIEIQIEQFRALELWAGETGVSVMRKDADMIYKGVVSLLALFDSIVEDE